MKIVIIGNGKIGSNLAALLVQEGHDITVVDCDETHLRKSQNTLDVMCIEGNGATAETQLEAGADKATLLIAATPYDEVNVLCCLIGKRLGTKKTISRVRMPEYYQQMHLIREDLGLSMVINPELSTADEIMRVLVFPSAAKVEVFGKGKLELVEYRFSAANCRNRSIRPIFTRIFTGTRCSGPFRRAITVRSAGDRPAPRPPWPAYPDFRQWNRPHRQRPFSAENSAAACWR